MADPKFHFGLRVPADLMTALKKRAAAANIPASHIVIAALRKHLGQPDPVETVIERESL